MSAATNSGPTRSRRASFGPDRLGLIAELEREHFWFAGRRMLIQRLLAKHAPDVETAVDVGCGTGSLLEVLVPYAERVVGVEPLGGDDPRIVVGNADALPLESGSAGLVTAFDVLEHVDDGAALAEFRRVLAENGWLIATVPVFPLLWSERDELAGHQRRYRRRQLVSMLETAGYTVSDAVYYQFILFPVLLATRLMGRRRRRATALEEHVPPVLNSVLRLVNETEVRLRLPWPYGSTLAVVARKTAM